MSPITSPKKGLTPGLKSRSLFAWLAVEEEGHPAAAVARFLGISRVGVKKAIERRLQSGQQGVPNE